MQTTPKISAIIMMLGLLIFMTACNDEADSEQANNENSDNTNQEDNEKADEHNHDENEEAEEDNQEDDTDDHFAQGESEEQDKPDDSDIFETMMFSVSRDHEEMGTFEIDLAHPESEYVTEDLETMVKVLEYYPDYELVNGEPASQSNYPVNPGFIFKVMKGDESDKIFFAPGVYVTEEDDPVFNIELVDYTFME